MAASYFIAGDQNPLGQYLVARSPMLSADNRPQLQIACIHCGNEYIADETSFHGCRCPACQNGRS